MVTSKPDIKSRVLSLMVVFSIVLSALALQLWSLQIIQGKDYSELAAKNRLRKVTTIAPRGRIFDRNGVELVGNRTTMAVLAPRATAENEELVKKLGDLLYLTKQDVIDALSTTKEGPLENRIIALDVPMDVIAYIAEHTTEFVDVEVEARSIRTYPAGAFASQLLGYTGIISESDMEKEVFADSHPSDIVGKSGAEKGLEETLRGVRGTQLVEVDAKGRKQRVVESIPPEPGSDVRLTIDVELQKSVESSLRQAIFAARNRGENAPAGAAVVMDTRSGEVLAMASYPTYKPSQFIGGISTKQWKKLNTKKSNYPLINRASGASYPPASTLKPFVTMTALNQSINTTQTTSMCNGYWKGFSQWAGKWCWLHSGHGRVGLQSSMAQSCDAYFYDTGKRFEEETKEGLQKGLRQWGFGSSTNIELPADSAGRVPDAAWKKKWHKDNPELSSWVTGDGVNLAIGQGDMLATPLQVAVAYTGIANKGKVLKPTIISEVLNSEGKAVIKSEREIISEPEVTKKEIKAIHRGLRGVVSYGTAAKVFSGFGVSVAGKTGTAEVPPKDDFAWFAGYAPADKPKYCVVVLVEEGGGGGQIAAPAVRSIMATLFHKKWSFTVGSDKSR